MQSNFSVLVGSQPKSSGNRWRKLPYAATMVFIALGSKTTLAQDLEPRSYTNIPIDTNFLALGYLHSDGEVAPSPGSAIEDAQLSIDSVAIGYARTFALAGSSAKFDMAVARSCFEGSANLNGERIEADRCGYTDPIIKLTWNFFGAPALTAKSFANWNQDIVIGTSLEVAPPLGSYDPDRLLNAGTNRWTIRPGVGMSQKLGRWYYNLMLSVRLYGDNDEYLKRGMLSQAPQYNFQGHLIYTLGRGHWLSLNSNYFIGGETTKNGVDSGDDQNNSRFGVTYSFPLAARHSIKLNYSTGVITRYGNDFESFGAYWLYHF
ncbi:hypothetical protein TUM4644_32550 [Shewanella colwelliana]|uniref:transporter n=1 Tax=Shewanella colwelliana TaxID=23 RepID=UPI001BC4E691|nr:transporter [Shewanella colwelliana]GIU32422.1 hypothetical protein TUM4644_32550 [Shewanella colwelliana]